MDILKRAEPYILVLGLVLCGTITSQKSFDRSLTIRHLIWLGVTLALFVSIAVRGDFGALRSPVIWLFGGYLFFVLLSGVQSLNKSEWLYEVLRSAMMLVFLFTIITITTAAVKNREMIYGALTFLAIGLSVYGLYKLTQGWTKGLMGNNNPWSAALMLLIPFCLKYKRRLIGYSAIALILANIAFVYTRSVMLAIVVMTIALFFQKRIVVGYLALILFILVVAYFVIFHLDAIVEKEERW